MGSRVILQAKTNEFENKNDFGFANVSADTTVFIHSFVLSNGETKLFYKRALTQLRIRTDLGFANISADTLIFNTILYTLQGQDKVFLQAKSI